MGKNDSSVRIHTLDPCHSGTTKRWIWGFYGAALYRDVGFPIPDDLGKVYEKNRMCVTS